MERKFQGAGLPQTVKHGMTSSLVVLETSISRGSKGSTLTPDPPLIWKISLKLTVNFNVKRRGVETYSCI
jgi:hypothetical protein